MAYDYDLVVIGSGPAGEKGATQSAYFGKKVAVIEKEPVLGGATANTGTLSSKTLRETSLYLSGFRARGLYGVDLALKRDITVQDLLHRERLVKQRERERVRWNLERHGIEILHGRAMLVDPHTIEIRSSGGAVRRITGEFILVATGSSPNRPSLFPFEDARVNDSDEILNVQEIPSSMVVVGGGVIGCEYACMFAALGVKVTVIDPRERLLTFLDGEISLALQAEMRAMGIELVFEDTVQRFEKGEPLHTLELTSGKKLQTRSLLVALGRNGNTRELGLERLGVQIDKRGRISVDPYYRTTVQNIYAAGDVIGFPALASTAMEQARTAMVHAFDLKYKSGLAPILPYGVYTIPEVSMAGETEESLRERSEDYLVGRAMFERNPRGEIIGEKHGMLKLLFRRSDMKLLGVHVIGEMASELVHIGLTALLMGATGELFIQTCYNYPTLSETYKYATYDALGARRGKPSFADRYER